MWQAHERTRCVMCKRPCNGHVGLICLDCEEILQKIQRYGYEQGFDAAFDSSITAQYPEPGATNEEHQKFHVGFRCGFERGQRTRRLEERQFRRRVLPEFMRELGRRRHGMLTLATFLSHRPSIAVHLDYHILKVIRKYVRSTPIAR